MVMATEVFSYTELMGLPLDEYMLVREQVIKVGNERKRQTRAMQRG